MSQTEVIVRVIALCLLGGYLLLRHVRRDRANRKDPVKWNGEVFDAKPLCARIEKLRQSRQMTLVAGPKESSRRRNMLKVMQKTVSRLLYFRHLRENASRG